MWMPKHDLGVILDRLVATIEMWNTMAAADRSEKSACSLNATISSFIQLEESYYCAVNISLNISEVSIAVFFSSFEVLKRFALGFK